MNIELPDGNEEIGLPWEYEVSFTEFEGFTFLNADTQCFLPPKSDKNCRIGRVYGLGKVTKTKHNN